MKKRDFLKYCSLMAGAMISGRAGAIAAPVKTTSSMKRKSKTMKLTFIPYELQLKHVFTLATSSRTTTPVVLTEIEYDGQKGYGEASMPPYLGESHETVIKFLSQVNLSQFKDPFLIEDIVAYLDGIMPGNYAAKASVDIALHDLVGKLTGKPWFRLWGLDPEKTPFTSFTIGIDTPEVVRQKVAEAEPYKILKVKLGLGNDKEMVETIRSISDKPICVDVNQGWKDRNYALEMAYWLKENNVIFLEQPMPKTMTDDIAWLNANSPVPVVADEALQTIDDLLTMKGVYSAINIKLMKCGGMNAAYKIALMASGMGMKVMIGCMTETSCAISAAAQLSPLAQWADLDGNLLISNDCYEGVTITDGKITLNEKPGIGITEKIKMFHN
ncbi:MAG: dipeptide epimerase [Bacteroidetes bacterium RBG_13_43_22]|nr:MAG: dipeptide epimerase [Bacteroidetes bacterium RBG_13_43_22]